MDDRSLKIEIDELIVYGTEIHHLGMYKCASDDINGGDIDSDTKKYLQNIEKSSKILSATTKFGILERHDVCEPLHRKD